MYKKHIQIPKRDVGSPYHHRMKNLDMDASPPSPTTRNDFSQQPKTIGEIQRSLQFIRQWIRETEPVISKLQSGKDDAPELINMLANRFRENLKEELIDRINSSVSELDVEVNNRIFKKGDEIRKEVQRISDNLYSIFKEMDEDLNGVKTQMGKDRQQYLTNHREQIQEMNRLADATDGVKLFCEDGLASLNEKFDHKLESALNVVKDLKELFTKRYDFLSLETTNAINSLTEMIQNNLSIQSLKMDKLHAELKENIQSIHNQNLENQQKLKAMLDSLNVRIKEIQSHSMEVYEAFTQNTEKKFEDFQHSSNQLKKNYNDILKRIDREAKLSLNIQQHQEKQNELFEEKLLSLSQDVEQLQDMSPIENLVDQKVQSLQTTLLDSLLTTLRKDMQQDLHLLQDTFHKTLRNELERNVQDRWKEANKSFTNVLKQIEEEFLQAEVRKVIESLVQHTCTMEHNENLDEFMLESTDLLQILSSTMAKEVNELVVGSIVDSIFQNVYEEITEMEWRKEFDTRNLAIDQSVVSTNPNSSGDLPSINPGWIKLVNEKLEFLERQLAKTNSGVLQPTSRNEINSLMAAQDEVLAKMNEPML